MTVRFNGAAWVRVLAPAIAVGVFYAALVALPRHRETQRIAAAAQQQRAKVENLQRRVAAQRQQWDACGGMADVPAQPPAATTMVSLGTAEPTAVQAFADVLAVFQSHGVQCTAAMPADQRAAATAPDTSVHRVHLRGDFGDMLAALDQIRATHPHTIVVGMTMQRPASSGACQWELAIRLNEDRT